MADNFDRKLNLAVWRSGLKPPNQNPPIIFSFATHNYIVDTVALAFGPAHHPLCELYI